MIPNRYIRDSLRECFISYFRIKSKKTTLHGLESKGGSLGKCPNLGCFSFGGILVMGGQGFLWSGGSGNSGNGGGSGLVTTGGS